MTEPPRPRPGPSLPSARALALAALLAVGAALAARTWLLVYGLSPSPSPLGPDAADWIAAARGLVEGVAAAVKSNRYPLVPWLAALLVEGTGIHPIQALTWISLGAGSLSAGAAVVLSGRYLRPGGALLAGLWVALSPGQLAVSMSTSGYAVFELGFLLTAGALLGAWGRAAPAIALLGAALVSSSMQQGLLCLLVLAPAALFARQPRALAGAVLGAGAGLLLAWLLHPDLGDPLGWMLEETWRYLAGNVPEEVGRSGEGYLDTWNRWAQGALDVRGWMGQLMVSLGAAGLLFGAMGWRVRPPRGRLWRGPRAEPPDRGAVLGLAWALAPLALLLPLMASSHHLSHLLPLLPASLGLTLVAALPGPSSMLGAAILVALLAQPYTTGARRFKDGLALKAGESQRERDFGQAMAAAFPPGAYLIVAPDLDPRVARLMSQARWCLPLEVQDRPLPGGAGQPGAVELKRAMDQGQRLVILSSHVAARWPAWPQDLVAVGPPLPISSTEEASAWLYTVSASSTGAP